MTPQSSTKVSPYTGSDVEIDKLAQPTPTQRRAFELLDATIPLSVA